MDRRVFLAGFGTAWWCSLTGCRGTQHARVMNDAEQDSVGTHAAGAETWEPLIERSVAQLLGRQQTILPASAQAGLAAPRKRICFVGIDNKSAEEMGDFKEQIYQKIDQCLVASDTFDVLDRRYVEAGLKELGLRPDDLFTPHKRREFVALMEQQEHPLDCLLYATVTSGTTPHNQKSYQRDYLLTLSLIDMQTGQADKESAEIRKAYRKSRLGGVL